MTADKPDDLLSLEQIAAEIAAAGIGLTSKNLATMIAAAKAGAEAKAHAVELFPLKPMLPSHVSYEVGRPACASGELRATKIGGDWFVSKEEVAAWLASSGTFFESEGAAREWRAYIAQLKPKWIG